MLHKVRCVLMKETEREHVKVSGQFSQPRTLQLASRANHYVESTHGAIEGERCEEITASTAPAQLIA